jgi:transcriptional regulator with XRE-family HTH domain
MMIHEKIKKLRQQKGWSQTQLANKMGVRSQHISRYERGNSNPSAETLSKFAEIFGVSVDYLLSEDEENTNTYKIKDKQLQRYFEEVDNLDEEDKNVIKNLIDAVLIRKKVKNLTSEQTKITALKP